MSDQEKRAMDKAKLAFFIKGVKTWGEVVVLGGNLAQRPKYEMSRLMNSVNSFNKMLDEQMGPTDAAKAQDFVDDLSLFFERFMAGSEAERTRIMDFVNGMEP